MERGAAQLKLKLKLKLTLWSLFSLSLLLLPSLEATNVRYCDKKFYPVKVQGVDISPDPVVSGNPATFTISASSDQAISGGTLVIDVSYFGVHVHTETHELCEEASCPIAVGDFVLSHSQTLPGFTPPGSYALKMKLEDEGNQLLTCISFSFKIGFGSSVSDS